MIDSKELQEALRVGIVLVSLNLILLVVLFVIMKAGKT